MENILSYTAIVFPADGRPASLVELMTSVATRTDPVTGLPIRSTRVPHPEVHMHHIAEGLGSGAWRFQIIELLDGMSKKFENPYVVFYPAVSRDGSQFPVNRCIQSLARELSGRTPSESMAWRGDIVVAKYHHQAFTNMLNASMSDFPLVKNYLAQHGPDTQVIFY